MINDYKEYESIEEWKAEGERIFGTKDCFKWAWQCPACKRKLMMEDYRKFKEQGSDPNDAYQRCIGRYTGGRSGPDKCDWAAFGFFSGPSSVKNDGDVIHVFNFWKGI